MSARADKVDVTAPRRVLPGRTSMVTRRCSERRMFLRPDHQVTQVFEYVLARACALHGVELHAYVVMSNHYHLVLTDVRGELPDFQRSLNGLVARAINCLRGRWESFWDPHSYNAVELLGGDDVVDKMAYTLLNPVRAGLVGKAGEWGGGTSAGMGFGHCKIVARPEVFFSEKMPATVELRLTAPPGFERVELGDRLRTLVGGGELEARSGGKPVGMRRVLGRDWADSPKTRAPRRGLGPRFAGRCVGTRCAALLEYRAWREAYAVALAGFRAGDRGVQFPIGTWQMVRRLGCVVAQR